MRAVNHLNRYVSNIDKFIDFYIDVLDYKLIDKGIKGNEKNYGVLYKRTRWI
ncbi:VOC family protein [Tissierella sp.]|uniref:VOC family protein n=1 Tax=Tissierella sp. TaxID=41274 RepID=UPI0028AA8775|nr:VOC family protein [Tissierella sp.]